jgi:hypothetical protein
MPNLDPALRLLIALAVAVRRRDAVLVQQIAEKVEFTLTAKEAKRAFSRLSSYGVTDGDMDWLRTAIS